MTASIFPHGPASGDEPTVDHLKWQKMGLYYYPLNLFFRQRFGTRVQKISLDGGFTCPNVDGTLAVGGCTICDNKAFSPSRRVRRDAISAQLQRGIERLRRRYKNEKFLAYYQPATNTYGPLEKLRVLWETALSEPSVVGLVIGTRPDCVPDEVLELVDEFAAKTYVSLELGVQTIHDASLEWMNRGHKNDASMDALARVQGRKFEVSVHIMLGLPGESREMVRQTAEQVARWKPASVKIHNLYAVEKTRLADQVHSGEVRLLELCEYIELLADFIERMPPTTVIERISGDAPPQNLIGPLWCLEKGTIKQHLDIELSQRGTRQGALWASA